MQKKSRFELFQFIFKENGHLASSWESKIGLGSLQVQPPINHDFFPKLRKIILFILATSLNLIKVFYTILIDSDPHLLHLYSLHVTNLLSLFQRLYFLVLR